MGHRILSFCCLFLLMFQQGKSQINVKDHPILGKELKKVYYDTSFKIEQNRILNQLSNQGVLWFSSPPPIELGKVCFTIGSCSLRFGPNFKKSKQSNIILPKGSMVWVVGYESNYDSVQVYDTVRSEINQFLYYVYFRVYVPSLKKIAIICGQYLPDYCISTRDYSDLDTLKPQNVANFQQYHSSFKKVPKTNNKEFYNDTLIEIQVFMNDWIRQNDRIFQVSLRKHRDSTFRQIFIQTGTVTPQNTLTVDAEENTDYLGSNIFPWIDGSRGLMGIRNVIEIEHWAEGCGQEGGDTYYVYADNLESENKLFKLGHFSCLSEAGLYAQQELLIFPTDTLKRINDFATPFLAGKPNYIIQFNETEENGEWDAESPEELIENGDYSIFPYSKSSSETKYTKWNRNPLNFKKIQVVDPCKGKSQN